MIEATGHAPVVLAKAGSAEPDVRSQHGDFEDWFGAVLELYGVSWSVVDLEQETLPPASEIGRLIVMGSMHSAYDDRPYVDRAGRWLSELVATETPVLGVCYGHQLLAQSLGGKVERDHRGLQAGNRSVELTEAGLDDPLFEGLPPEFPAYEMHEDTVTEAPPSSVVLARTAEGSIEALAYGPKARSVQFHPEMTDEILATLLRARRDVLRRQGEDADAMADSVMTSPEARYTLVHFLTRF